MASEKKLLELFELAREDGRQKLGAFPMDSTELIDWISARRELTAAARDYLRRLVAALNAEAAAVCD